MAPRLDVWQKKKRQNVIFDVMSEVQKNSEDVSAEIGIVIKNPVHLNFVGNLTSKLARSTLTSPGTVRVKGNN